MESTPWMAFASTAGSLMSPTTTSVTPRARSRRADASVWTQARTGARAARSFGISNRPWLPWAAVTRIIWLPVRSSSVDGDAAAPHAPQVTGVGDLGGRIAADQNEVGPSARRDDAAIGEAEVIGRAR